MGDVNVSMPVVCRRMEGKSPVTKDLKAARLRFQYETALTIYNIIHRPLTITEETWYGWKLEIQLPLRYLYQVIRYLHVVNLLIGQNRTSTSITDFITIKPILLTR